MPFFFFTFQAIYSNIPSDQEIYKFHASKYGMESELVYVPIFLNWSFCCLLSLIYISALFKIDEKFNCVHEKGNPFIN